MCATGVCEGEEKGKVGRTKWEEKNVDEVMVRILQNLMKTIKL